jgi:hypothetical protein
LRQILLNLADADGAEPFTTILPRLSQAVQ